MMTDKEIREEIDYLMFEAQLQTLTSKDRMLRKIAELKEKCGHGWWCATLENLEKIAKN